ncbi:MAG: type II toxin-antitoxin system HipA family toxin, partial [Acidiferrobacterales bacterium]
NGKRDDFVLKDLVAAAESISLSKPERIINDVIKAVERWPAFANEAGINNKTIKEISAHQRLDIA